MQFSTFLKGLIIGGTMTIPGVSGGTMAMLLGIYDKLIGAVANLFKNFWKNILFLFLFLLGAGIGMVIFSHYVLELMERYPMPVKYFFIGAVAGGIPLLERKVNLSKFTWKMIAYPVLGILIVTWIEQLPSEMFSIGELSGIQEFIMQFIGGSILAIALILPGISVSHMLLILGIYEDMMQAISHLDLVSLLPLGIGVLTCTLLTSKLIDTALTKYPQVSYLIILGFVIASLSKIYPGMPRGLDIISCLLSLFLGFSLMYFIQWREKSTM